MEDINCPVCGYYCSGKGGKFCINKPSMIKEITMSKMEERFKRAYQVLDKVIKECHPTPEQYNKFVVCDIVDLMWLRNEADLWSDYETDGSWVINGINYDPNHPDNLSHSVYKLWQQVHKHGQ
ncbi:hypothetical protein VPIG_00040 [Vibrio phage PWH3a-P1]|uniref:hypothetical protein n=1 Tax=Vibrio phage PWH3a-P1 TaxID=754058 RepID=UPI0002C124C8|nr:hypothetical protein VPIG_00040 [Vibrio phage PWH3a-P1]AGH31898.1 hypothetical protein VPIG_00040 [Vibrio phage PWH3a-P1]